MPDAPPRAPKPPPGTPAPSGARTTTQPLQGTPPAALTDSIPVEGSLAAELRRRIPDVVKKARETQEVERCYHVGTLPGCPRQNIDLAGVSFPRQNEDVIVVSPSETTRVPRPGAFVWLTPTAVSKVLDAIARRVVRFRRVDGTEGDGTVFDVTTGRTAYRPMPGDRPLADFVYMVPRPDLDQIKANPEPKYPEALSAAPVAVPPAAPAPAPAAPPPGSPPAS